MASFRKIYFITALELHSEIFLTPDDGDFASLMKKYENLKKRYNTRSKKWVADAKALNTDFEKYICELFAREPFKLKTPPCGIEVYSVEEILEGCVGWKNLGLIGLEFTSVPFEEVEEHVFVSEF